MPIKTFTLDENRPCFQKEFWLPSNLPQILTCFPSELHPVITQQSIEEFYRRVVVSAKTTQFLELVAYHYFKKLLQQVSTDQDVIEPVTDITEVPKISPTSLKSVIHKVLLRVFPSKNAKDRISDTT